MVERIIEFSAKNKYLVMIVVVAAMAAATWCVKNLRLDAIPDLSDTQVIVFSRWDRSPDIIEDQVTYPIVTALLGAPKIKAIRGSSDFGGARHGLQLLGPVPRLTLGNSFTLLTQV